MDNKEDGEERNDRRVVMCSEVILANLDERSGRVETVRRERANLRGMEVSAGRAYARLGPEIEVERRALVAEITLRWRVDMVSSLVSRLVG